MKNPIKTPYCSIDGMDYQLHYDEHGTLRFPDVQTSTPDLNRWVIEYIEGKRPLKDLFDNAVLTGSSYEYVYGIYSKGGMNRHIVQQGPEPSKKFRLYLGKTK